MSEPLVRLDRVYAGYRTSAGPIVAVHDVSLTINDNEILGIVGESGCGKSTLIKLIYGQISGPLALFSGTVTAFIDGIPVPGAELHRHWWRFISVIPQGSMSVLNPVLRIEDQMLDAMPRRRIGRKAAMRNEIVAFFEQIGLDAGVLRLYPHQLSGGMRQRVLVALATFLHPRVVLADEPTTALDVIMQKRILMLILDMQRRMRNAIVMVSHDLGVQYQLAHRIVVVYAGELVEIGATDEVFGAPLHPYTRALVEAIPHIGDNARREGLEGRPPSLLDPPPGCRFHPRCPEARDICRRVSPALEEKAPRRFAACHFR